MRVPLVDLKPQYEECKPEIDAALAKLLDSQYWIMGPTVTAFEADLAQFAGVKHAIGCASGTDALQLALMALDVQAGDEVITTPFTFAATAETIALLGAKPVYADIEADTYNLDINQVESLITARTKAIIPVHLYGQSANMDELNAIAQSHGVAVIEDAAQALGAEYKGREVCSLGTMACTSFFPAKNLGAFGDAGAVFTNDDDLADRINALRLHGSKQRYLHEILGANSRIDALQAAILHAKLPHLDNWNRMRGDLAAYYNEKLADAPVTTPVCRPDRTHIYQQYTIRSRQRNELQAHLRKMEIPTAVHYPIPLFRQPAFLDAEAEARCPQAIRAAAEVMSLPMFPHLTVGQADLVIEAILDFYKKG